MATTTVRIEKEYSEILDNLMAKLGYYKKKYLLECMIDYFNRYPFNPRDTYSLIDDKIFEISKKCSDIKNELNEIKKELKKNK